MTPTVGIDLGTSCSTIGWVVDGVPRLVEIEGSVLLPSVVCYATDPVLVGQPALNQRALEPDHTITSSKRKMGSSHTYQLAGRELQPVDVAQQILLRLVKAAEAELGARPEKAVITVPAWFTQPQRLDTRRAGELAGLEVVRILNEPTAAALAHAHGQDRQHKLLIYDFGGGTFDVSIVEQDGPIVEVKASHGDTLLGGDDVDNALLQHVMRHLSQTDRALHDALMASSGAQITLKAAIEKAKITLGAQISATLRAPFLLRLDGSDRHLEMELTREDLDHAVFPLIERTFASVDRVLSDAGLAPSELDELLLVGGSTLLPQVLPALHERYGLLGSHAIPPQRAVGLGAAIQAAIVDGSRVDGILVDVAPYSLSIGVLEPDPFCPAFRCEIITPRNTPLPSHHTTPVTTCGPQQRTVRVAIFQGEHPDPRGNVFLGQLQLSDLECAPSGEFERPLHVSFQHDLDGVVHVEVVDTLSGHATSCRIATDGAELVEEKEVLISRLVDEGLLDESYEPAKANESDWLEEHTDQAENQDEAERTFRAVLEGSDLPPEASSQLQALAKVGLELLAANDSEGVLSTYDQLADELFDHGVFL